MWCRGRVNSGIRLREQLPSRFTTLQNRAQPGELLVLDVGAGDEDDDEGDEEEEDAEVDSDDDADTDVAAAEDVADEPTSAALPVDAAAPAAEEDDAPAGIVVADPCGLRMGDDGMIGADAVRVCPPPNIPWLPLFFALDFC